MIIVIIVIVVVVFILQTLSFMLLVSDACMVKEYFKNCDSRSYSSAFLCQLKHQGHFRKEYMSHLFE